MFYYEGHYMHLRYHRSINRITGTVCLILWFLYVWIISPGDSIRERLQCFVTITIFWPLMVVMAYFALNAMLIVFRDIWIWLQGYDRWY